MTSEIPLQLDENVKALGSRAQAQLTEQFARIDAIAQENTARVLAAFQEHRVAESYFSGTTGYGYDDLGRDKLDEIYADIFGTIPIAESLYAKGAGLGTVLSFMMAVTALSLPSLVMLRKAVKPKLLAVFTGIVTVGIMGIGFLFKLVGPLFA